MKPSRLAFYPLAALLLGSVGTTTLALVVPNEIQMPGTQPLEPSPLDVPAACDGCHGSYDPDVEPLNNWRGSMMAHATRDPMFWAATAIAEQDFDGAGDLCIRCHTPKGWMEDRSTPTDGSALIANDAYGVSCDVCHSLVLPDESEHDGVQTAPFEAYGGAPVEPYTGSGQMVTWTNSPDKLGPYDGVTTPHGYAQSLFHRTPELCGTCHDVSNPFVGDMAANNGSIDPLPPLSFSGDLGDPVDEKAAFNNPPHAYGAVERTYSEYKASGFDGLRVSDYPLLPPDLQRGSIRDAYEAAQAAGNGGNYADGATRFFTCQACHMPPVTGQGCVVGPTRTDLPLHDLTGGNYWMPEAIKYLDGLGQLQIGGGLTAAEEASMDEGADRARANLEAAASLMFLEPNKLRVVNLTGHKLITGYPEGRRMWLNLRWFDRAGTLIREDGKYGSINVTINSVPAVVDSIVDFSDPNLHIYDTHKGISQDWAVDLIGLGVPSTLVLAYDRLTEAAGMTLGDLAAMAPGSEAPTFHFVMNNVTISDTRIPPYEMDYDSARERNALPVPETLYGNPGSGGVYQHWDDVDMNPPAGAVRGKIRLLYQPTSWEYMQFLYLANDGSVTNLADEGDEMLDAWLNTGMAEPHVMAEIEWRKWGRRKQQIPGQF